MRLLLLTLFFSTLLNATIVRHEIIKEYQLSRDGVHFTTLKDFTSLDDIKGFVGGKLIHKVILNRALLTDAHYYVKSIGNAQGVTSVSLPHQIINNDLIYRIDHNTPETIYIGTETKDVAHFMLFHILNDHEYKEIYPLEKFWFGLVYGLMLFAFLNSLIFFLYNRQKSFLYYALLQLSLIIFLMNFTYANVFFPTLMNHFNLFFLSLDLAILFSTLFNMAFLQTKKHLPHFHKLLQAIVGLIFINIATLLLFQKNLVFDYLPPYLLLLPLLVSAVLMIKKGHIDARYYLFGWAVVVVGVMVSATKLIDLSSIYTMHIIFPFETIVFSFALGYQLTQIQKKALHHEKLLMQQSKLASMGEMVANIAHQWRQPLNNISCTMMNLKAAQKHHKLTEPLFDKKSQQINEQLEFMSQTIEDFRSFFVLERQKKPFYLKEVVQRSYALATSHITDQDISFTLEVDEWLSITSYENELSHVIFNLFNNAAEAFHNREIKDARLYVTASQETKWITITVRDNAGGIPKKLLDKIFEPYFSTKEKGMGIGLYMSKMIIEEHMGGQLKVKNRDQGVIFTIKLPSK